jgi:hypothetical protein
MINKEEQIDHCKQMIKNKGTCDFINCTDCPGKYNCNGKSGWRILDWDKKDKQAVESCRKWLELNDKPLTNIYEEE